jgi:hypothetical protein
MRTAGKNLTVLFGVLAMVLILAIGAGAQCGSLDQLKSGTALSPQSWLDDGLRAGSFLRISGHDSEHSIVGFWKFEMKAKDSPGLPDGLTIDHGFAQWHSDGTEIMNSSRAPATGSFCLGVWKRTADSYKLNHFALSWNPDNTFLGPANIREDVRLSEDGKSFSGTFSLTQYNQAGTAVFHAVGEITGKRITVHTTITDVL